MCIVKIFDRDLISSQASHRFREYGRDEAWRNVLPDGGYFSEGVYVFGVDELSCELWTDLVFRPYLSGDVLGHSWQVVSDLPDSIGADLDRRHISLRVHPGRAWSRSHVVCGTVRVGSPRLLWHSGYCFSSSFDNSLQSV